MRSEEELKTKRVKGENKKQGERWARCWLQPTLKPLWLSSRREPRSFDSFVVQEVLCLCDTGNLCL